MLYEIFSQNQYLSSYGEEKCKERVFSGKISHFDFSGVSNIFRSGGTPDGGSKTNPRAIKDDSLILLNVL